MDDETRAERPLMLLDTPALYYRAFYALPTSITTDSGWPVNAVRGLLDMLAHLIATYRPACTLACWDDDWRPEFRVRLMPSYKAHRVTADGEETPPELAGQLDWIRRALEAADIPVVGCEGFEADDVIASLAAQTHDDVLVVTGDRDLFQLVSDRIGVIYPRKSIRDSVLVDPATLDADYGVAGSRYTVMAALRGDPSDGLPGVPGVGAKTAAKLVAAFGDLESIIGQARSDTPDKPMTARIAAAIATAADESRRTLQVVSTVDDLPVAGYLTSEDRPGRFDTAADRTQDAAWASDLNFSASFARLLSARGSAAGPAGTEGNA